MVVQCCVVLCGTSIMKEEQEKHHDLQELKSWKRYNGGISCIMKSDTRQETNYCLVG
jgi:hypothetical protein